MRPIPRPPADRAQRLAQLAVHAAGLAPLALLVLDARLQRLTENPLQALTLRTGKFALLFLIASLAVTPLVSAFGWRWLLPQRRTLGLYAFLYAALHFLTFAWLDYNLDLAQILPEVAEKRYILAGAAAFLILLALAASSSRAAQRALGRRWKQLHRGVYLAAILVIAHYGWQVKGDIRPPLAFGALLALLLALRHPAARARLARWRAGRSPARSPARAGPGAAPDA